MGPSPFAPFIDTIGIWVVCFLTLAVFSFLYRDNPIYKVAEHLYVGIAAGYYFYQAFRSTIYPNLFQHAIEGAREIGKSPEAWETQWRWGALVLGILILSRLVPKVSWVSRWPMGLVVGAFAGLNLVGFAQANLMDQIHATFLPLVPDTLFGGTKFPFWPRAMASEPTAFNNLVFVIGVITVLTYFLFSATQRTRFAKLQYVGMAFIMVTFGATYGSIVLARISLLIGRVQVLANSNRPDIGYPPLVCAAIIILGLVIWRLKFYRPEEEK